MKRRKKLNLHIGLRTVKTAIAVTIALFLSYLLGTPSPIFAGLGAIIAMTRVVREGFRAVRTQFVGLSIGGAVGFLVLLIDSTPSILLTGLGVLLAMVLCIHFKLYDVVSTAAIIALSACTSTDGNVMLNLAYRMLDTAIGLGCGLAINILVKPYNNRLRVVAKLYEIADFVPTLLDTCVLKQLYPDLAELEHCLHTLEAEFEIYRMQHFRSRRAHEKDAIHLEGLCRLAARIVHELSALANLDSFGTPTQKNLDRLLALGLEAPPAQCMPHRGTEEEDYVTNYHLEKALDGREYLLMMLDD